MTLNPLQFVEGKRLISFSTDDRPPCPYCNEAVGETRSHCPLCHAKYRLVSESTHYHYRGPIRFGRKITISTYNSSEHLCELTDKIIITAPESYNVKKITFQFLYKDDPEQGTGKVFETTDEYIDKEPYTIHGETIEKRLAEAIRLIRDTLKRAKRRYATAPTDKFIKPWAILAIIPDNYECSKLRPLYEQAVDDESLFISCEFVADFLEDKEDDS